MPVDTVWRMSGARAVTGVAIALPAAAVIVAADRELARSDISLFRRALLDESAHIATAVLAVLPLRAHVNRQFVLGAIAGAVALDVDHVPGHLGITRKRRPGTHSLTMLVAVGVLASATRSPVARSRMGGACVGLASHLLRDLYTGGVPLLWPITSRKVGFGVSEEDGR
jgi:LexA-binding, inner membrane-associated putative hydrolase